MCIVFIVAPIMFDYFFGSAGAVRFNATYPASFIADPISVKLVL